MIKDSHILSILRFKCPKCHQGDLFCNKSIYKLKGFFDMPDNCLKCNQDFQIEAGFYYGAMYVSYALTIAINVAIFVALIVFDIYALNTFFITAFIVLIITLPYVFKISRVIWISLMIKYDSNAIKDYAAQHQNQ